jgi:hypothetical protein
MAAQELADADMDALHKTEILWYLKPLAFLLVSGFAPYFGLAHLPRIRP